MNDGVLKICIVDDHEIFLEGLVALLESSARCRVVGRASDGMQAASVIMRSECDICILDVDIPHKNGIEVLKELQDVQYQGSVLMLSMYKNKQIATLATKFGASGYMLKSEAFTHLVDAIERIDGGGDYFSPEICEPLSGQMMELMTKREKEVSLLIANGLKVPEISKVLSISPKTVEVHRKNIYDKLSIGNIVEITHIVLNNRVAFEEACPGLKVVVTE